MTEPIRLVQITHDLAIGGLQQVVVNLCRAIDRTRFDVTVLCLRALGPLTQEIEKLGIEVILLPQKKTGTDYFSFLKVATILRKKKTQVIHTHNTQPLFDGVMGSFFSGRRCRIVHTDHARQFPDKKRYMFAEWCMSHFVYKMVGVSEQTTENLRIYESISTKKLMTIHNGIDGSRFEISIDSQLKRLELGIRATGPVIGVISRLEKVKGISYLLQAMPEVITRYPKITLLIVGEGDEMSNLTAEAELTGISENVIFTGVRLDTPEIFKILDCFLLPSLSEGLPMGLLEAMASECPVIASKVGGIPMLIDDEASALLVTPSNSAELSSAIIRMLAQDDLRRKLSGVAKAIFKAGYDSQNMALDYMNLYKNFDR